MDELNNFNIVFFWEEELEGEGEKEIRRDR